MGRGVLGAVKSLAQLEPWGLADNSIGSEAVTAGGQLKLRSSA